MKKAIQLIITNIFFLLSSIAMADTSTMEDLKNISNSWYFLEINPNFDKESFFDQSQYPANLNLVAGSIILREKQTDNREEYSWAKKLKAIPLKIKNDLFSKKTNNPFKPLFPEIYTLNGKKKLRHCGDFVGVQFELDDIKETQEWLIAAPVEYCIYGKKAIIEDFAGYDSSAHIWILQKKQNNHYRVLMESEGVTYVINKKHQGYKRISTYIYNKHIYRKKALRNPDSVCGSGGIGWQYQSDSYQPVSISVDAYSCSHSSEKYRIKMAKEVVKPLLVRWLNTFSRVPVTINEKNEVVPLQINQHPKQKKTVSNCIKNNAMHKAAARGDYRFIAQCLRNL